MFRPFIASIVVLAACSPCLAQSAPNIILILTDDQGWTDTSVMMDPTIPESMSDFYQTPHIAQIAAQGMRFSQAYSAAAICGPSRVAIQSGKSPAQLQITTNPEDGLVTGAGFEYLHSAALTQPMPRTGLPINGTTIPQQIKQDNPDYITAHFGKWHVNTLTGYGPDPEVNVYGYDYTDFGHGDPVTDPKGSYALAALSNDFIQSSVDQEKPFFLQTSFWAPHLPIGATQGTIDKYESLPPGERHYNAVYAAMLEELDTGIGQIMQKVQDLGIADNTYVIFTSDNGGVTYYDYLTNNYPLLFGKDRIWDGGIRVPFIVKGPGIEAGSVSDVPVIAMDIYNTIADLSGGTSPMPDGNEGASLVPILQNGGVLPDGMDSLQRTYGPNGELFFHRTRRVPASAIRDGDYKLVKVYGQPGQPDEVFLFNLIQNPTESAWLPASQNLADEMPAKTAEMLDKLETWLADVDASFAYDVAENTSIIWSADQSGPTSGDWRSVTNHDYLFRELWESDDASAPTLVPTTSSLYALPGQAFNFDGGDVMERKFFHVSTSDASDRDLDHSATIEMWLRLDGLGQNQVLFESGDGQKGLSLTLGDADSDGLFDDVRFRVLDEDGSYLTVTAPFGETIDPTSEFVQLVAVINDSSTNRYASLYLNGLEVARVSGTDGSDPLDWDGFDPAGLGGIGGAGLGANGGLGDLPFTGGGLVGEVSAILFDNVAITSHTAWLRYISASPLVGDLNGDGFVGVEDLNIVLSAWNTDNADADQDGDHYVGISDLNVVLGNWNAGQAPASVPEPSATLILTLALVRTAGTSRSRSRR